MTIAITYADKIGFEQEIECITEGLSAYFKNILLSAGISSASIVSNYISGIMREISDAYRRLNI